VYAQQAPTVPPAPSIQEVVVTGSRTISNGDAAPTPLTVLSAEQLEMTAPSTIADALALVPQFRGSLRPSSFVSTQSPVTAFVNLRGLSNDGAPRTLVLLDGRRINPASAAGQVDVNSLPNLLVKRVDIVTGGASAAYGTDAVAGVVNYILDKDFVGLKGDVNAGVSGRSDDQSQRAAIAAGSKFLEGRLHVIGSAEYYNSKGIVGSQGRSWAQRHCEPILNPTYPQDGRQNYLFRCGVVGTDFAPGGVITSGPLKGTQFRPGGIPAPYLYGREVTAGNTMLGGDGLWLERANILSPLKTESAFSHADYQLTDTFNLFAEAAYARNEAELAFIPPFFAGGSAFTIFSDNPFIPAATKSQMAAAGVSTFRLGRLAQDWGSALGTNVNESKRGTLGFTSHHGEWTVDGYADFGRTDINQDTDHQLNRARAYEAADAVVDPASGRIVCRSTLSNAQNGCAPLNVFGVGTASQDALNYIFGHAWTRSWSSQEAAELTARGSPFSMSAGQVQIAVGLDYRKLSAASRADSTSVSAIAAAPGSLGTPAAIIGTLGGWLAGNQVEQPERSYNVKEAFTEAFVPLLHDVSMAHSLDFDGAFRYAKYSTAGGVNSWKLGLSYAPIEDVRFRVARSRDVRAPNLFELYGPRRVALTSVFDPVANANVQIAGYSGGNPNLSAEFADTTTLGFVLTPRSIPRLSLAVDYYDIKMRGAISTLSAQNIISLCAAGNSAYCQYISRLPTPENTLVSADASRLNLNLLRSSGVDLEGNYTAELTQLNSHLSGFLSFRALASYLKRLTTTDAFGTVTEYAGVNGGENVGSPSWQGSVAVTYSNAAWTIFLQERFISSGQALNTLGTLYTTGTRRNSVDFNHVPSIQYTDLTVDYSVSSAMRLYLTVSNLFDKDPPEAPTRAGLPITTLDTNGTLYDVVGRYFTFGVRFRF
jgi:outer membrane receptor protein involved in Fe transport